MTAFSSDRLDRLAMPLGVASCVVLIIWFAGWTGQGSASLAPEVLWILLSSGVYSVAWLAAAVGLGWPVQAVLLKGDQRHIEIQAGLGVATMMSVDQALGAAGLLQAGGGSGAWLLVALGVVLLIIQSLRKRGAQGKASLALPHWLIWTAAPSIALLLTASTSAPGWLWASEFGGYDALSYHLQLPKEWLWLGRIQPVEHNVYSYFPGYVEAAYYHLAVLIGDGVRSVYAAQMLHAGLVLLTAAAIYRLVALVSGQAAGACAAGVHLATPWVIVTGSLGYNEGAVSLMLATALLVVSQGSSEPWRRGATVGLLAGAACGAKLTAFGMVGLPVAAMLAMSLRPRQWSVAVIAGAMAAIVMLTPYLVRNQAYAGNPVFPFATSALGPGHWLPEQADIWTRGHISDNGLAQRVVELWNQFIRYGMGGSPVAREPWKPQWSIVPILGILGLLLGWRRSKSRRLTRQIAIMLLLQIAFWMTMTHLKSRFLLPAAVHLSIAAGIGLAAGAELVRNTTARSLLLAGVLAALNVIPVWIYATEANGSPGAGIGQAAVFSGEGLSEAQRQQFGSTALPAIAINHLLPGGSKVLLVGHATPLYFDLDRIAYQTTWDRGPLSVLVRAWPDDPASWCQALRKSGFSHILIDQTMLAIWERSSWNDPLLTRQSIQALVEQCTDVEFTYPNGVTLLRLNSF